MLAKDLGNLPGNICTPAYLADQARELGKRHGFKVQILEQADVEKLCPEARNLLEETPENLQALILGVQRVTKAVRAALNPDGIVVTQFNGAPAGQTIYHLHFHIIPRWEGQVLGRHGAGGMADMAELNALAGQIAAKIS